MAEHADLVGGERFGGTLDAETVGQPGDASAHLRGDARSAVESLSAHN
jgi:hypothetical protein